MPEQIDNILVTDWWWEGTPPEVKEKLNGSGWRQIGTDIFVPDDDAFDYAIEHCTEAITEGFWMTLWQDDFKEMVVEWFYSDGNWVKED